MSTSPHHASATTRPLGTRVLCAAGWLLVLAGLANGVAATMYEFSRHIFWQSTWITVAVVLIFAFRDKTLKTIGRVVGAGMLAYWMNFDFQLLSWRQPDAFSARAKELHFGLMLTALGWLLVATNGPHRWLRRLYRRGRVFIIRRRKTALLTAAMIFWLLNPDHAHWLCNSASTVAEKCGAYETAITFTTLARDSFPQITFCGTCSYSIACDLSERIEELESKQSSQTAITSQTTANHSDEELPTERRLFFTRRTEKP